MLLMPILVMLTFTIMSKADFTVMVSENKPINAARTANKNVKANKRLLEDAIIDDDDDDDDDDSSSGSSDKQEKDEKEMARYNDEIEDTDESQEDETEPTDEEENDTILRSVSDACKRKMYRFCYKKCKSAYRELCSTYNCRWYIRSEFNKNCRKRCKK